MIFEQDQKARYRVTLIAICQHPISAGDSDWMARVTADYSGYMLTWSPLEDEPRGARLEFVWTQDYHNVLVPQEWGRGLLAVIDRTTPLVEARVLVGQAIWYDRVAEHKREAETWQDYPQTGVGNGDA